MKTILGLALNDNNNEKKEREEVVLGRWVGR